MEMDQVAKFSISDAGIGLIRKEEGCKLEAYKDTRGIWTIGVGHTGPEVKQGLEINQETADRLLMHDVSWAEKAVNDFCDDSTKQHQFDAMVSLCFNIGQSAFRGSSVARLHKNHKYPAAADAFLLWKRAGRNPNILLPRRQRERAIYLTEE